MRHLSLAFATALLLSACGGDSSDTSDDADALPSVSEGIEALPPATPEAPAVSGATVVDVVAEAPELTTLARLLRESGVADALAAEGPFTLFAPSDTAFEGADLDALAADPEALQAVLQSHALAFRTFAADLDFEQTVEALSGAQLAIAPGDPPSVSSGGVLARLVRTDLDSANGIVHVIDAV
ncbi:MAG: fasciclin domain-containing protein, partial [Bacteroidota bacterium]